MNLTFSKSLASNYTSKSQISRVLTENWVKVNLYCPNCGNKKINNFENNRPAADFFCKNCYEEFELKSKKGLLGNRIVDGAYNSLIKRIQSDNNPNFFFLSYNIMKMSVVNLLIIPKHYFIVDFIERRKPLSINAKRSGWVGCNIILNRIPKKGRIFIVKNAQIVKQETVMKMWKETIFLKSINQKSRNWLIDILNCLDKIPTQNFKLNDVYLFENDLKLKHPNNNFIKDKIRQQLQILRDKNIVEFTSRGNYKKVENYE